MIAPKMMKNSAKRKIRTAFTHVVPASWRTAESLSRGPQEQPGGPHSNGSASGARAHQTESVINGKYSLILGF